MAVAGGVCEGEPHHPGRTWVTLRLLAHGGAGDTSKGTCFQRQTVSGKCFLASRLKPEFREGSQLPSKGEGTVWSLLSGAVLVSWGCCDEPPQPGAHTAGAWGPTC